PLVSAALASARPIEDIHTIAYPEGTRSPSPALNANAQPGKFRYDRAFLLQFRGVCRSRPDALQTLHGTGL
ncbi:eukaryotic translation initiation factor 4G1, eIF4E-binding domain-containing protein, partial [Trametes elegans]